MEGLVWQVPLLAKKSKSYKKNQKANNPYQKAKDSLFSLLFAHFFRKKPKSHPKHISFFLHHILAKKPNQTSLSKKSYQLEWLGV